MSLISLPAFWERREVMRMLLQFAVLIRPAPHLSIHCVQQGLGLFIIHLWIRLHNLNQLAHSLLSGLEGPNAAVLLIRRT